MQITAHLHQLRMSPRKVRLVANLLKDMDVHEADAQLTHLQKGAVIPIRKLLHSAIANAEHNAKLDRANLFVRQVRVDQGTTLKRSQPRAFGRATPIRKRTSHVTIVLDERVPTALAKTKDVPALSAPTLVTERPHVAREHEHEPDAPAAGETAEESVAHSGAITDVRRQGKHRHKEHEDARSGKRPGGFFKRLFTRRSGER